MKRNHQTVKRGVRMASGRKLISCLLTAVLVIGLMPSYSVFAFASGEESIDAQVNDIPATIAYTSPKGESAATEASPATEQEEPVKQDEHEDVVEDAPTGANAGSATEPTSDNVEPSAAIADSAVEADGIETDSSTDGTESGSSSLSFSFTEDPVKVEDGIAYYKAPVRMKITAKLMGGLDKNATQIIATEKDSYKLKKTWYLKKTESDTGLHVWQCELELKPAEMNSLLVRVFEAGEDEPAIERVYGKRSLFKADDLERKIKDAIKDIDLDKVKEVGDPFIVEASDEEALQLDTEALGDDAADDLVPSSVRLMVAAFSKLKSLSTMAKAPAPGDNGESTVQEILIEFPTAETESDGVLYYRDDFNATITVIDSRYDMTGSPYDGDVTLVVAGQEIPLSLSYTGTLSSDAPYAVENKGMATISAVSEVANIIAVSAIGETEGSLVAVESEKKFIIDKSDPSISIAAKPAENATAYTDPDGTKILFAKDSDNTDAIVSVLVEDENLDSASKPTVKVTPYGETEYEASVTWDDSAEGKLTGTFGVSSLTSYAISVTGARDLAGHIKDDTFNVELTQDSDAPELAVTFDEPTSKTIDDTAYYANKRTALVTVTDANFDADSIAVEPADKVAKGSDDKVNWEDIGGNAHQAKVEFDGNASYQLIVSGTDIAGNPLVAADSSITVESGAYESDSFWVWENPMLSVAADPTASDTEGKFFNISEKDLEFTISVVDPFFDADKTSISIDPDERGTIEDDNGAVKWTAGAGDLDPHTAKVVYGKDDESSGNALTITSVERLFVGSDETAVDDTGVYKLSDFTVDAEPPEVALGTWVNDAKRDVEASDDAPRTLYFGSSVNDADVMVTDTNLGDGSGLSIAVEGSDAEYGFTFNSPSNATEGTSKVAFPAVPGDSKTYQLKVSGSDGSGIEMAPYELNVIVDNAAPVIEVSYGEAEEKGTRIEKDGASKLYYNEAATATITVTDDNIDASDSCLQVIKDGTVVPGVEWSSNGGTYSAMVEVDEDTSSLQVVATDYAGNERSHDETIVISQEKPRLNVEYSQGFSRNEPTIHAYNSEQGVTVTVTVTGLYLADDDYDDTKLVARIVDSKDPSATSYDIELARSSYDPATKEYVYQGECSVPAVEAKYDATATGTDLCGNQLVAEDGAKEAIGEALSDGKYSSTLLLDWTSPTVEVTYNKEGEDAKTLPHGDQSAVSGSDLRVTVTVKDDNLDANLMTIQFGDDESVHPAVSGDTGSASHTFRVDDGDDTTFSISVSGQDAAQNRLKELGENGYLAYVTVDKKQPALVVDFADDPTLSESLDSADAVRYYSRDSVEATLKAVERHFIKGTANVSVTSSNGKTSSWDVSDWTATEGSDEHALDITFGGEGVADDVYTLTVEGADEVGNVLMSGDENNPTYVEEGTYTSTIVIDQTPPELMVEWGDEPQNGKYLNSDRSAKVTVSDSFIDIATVKVNGVDNQEWEQAGNTYTMTVDYKDEGSDFRLTVEGADKAGNLLVGKDDLGVTTEDGVYDSGEFVIDKTAPKVEVKTSQKLSRNVSGVDYFNSANDMSVMVSVSDEGQAGDNFDPRNDSAHNTEIALSGKPIATYSLDGWGDNDLYTVAFNENDASAKTSGLTVTAYDLAGNCTVYSYGAAKATGITSAGSSASAEYGKTVDAAGTVLAGSAFTVDATAADVAAQNKDGNIPTNAYSGSYGANDGTYIFFKDSTSFKVVLTDDIGLHRVQLMNDKSGAEKSYLKDESPKDASSYNLEVNLKDASTFKDGTEYSGDYVLRVEDTANNVRYWKINVSKGTIEPAGNGSTANTPLYKDETDLYPAKAIQDTVKPTLKFGGVSAGSYYNSPQTVRLDVTELNFGYLKDYDGGQQVITIRKEEGRAGRAQSNLDPITVSGFNASNAAKGEYYRDMPFTSDGHYSLEATLTDPAGNVSSKATMGEFTIDRTKPTISVTFDNNSAVNGKYYPAGRTATIVITEHNFNPADFNIETTGSIGSWSNNGDEHTIRVAFTTDGTYTMTISGKDMAGNALDTYTEDEFIIDLTNPQIDFSVVEDGHAYNGMVTPTILFSDDANFDPNGTEYTLTGTKNGGVAYGASSSSGDNSLTVTYNDFGNVGLDEYDPNYDDIYTLEAHMSDMAGNTAEGTITFSVNRFGSNFLVLSEMADENGESFITNERPEIRIQEINVSGVETEAHGVTVTNGTTVTNLRLNEQQQDTGYVIAADTSNDETSRGWASYTYIVAPGNFDRDGRYFVAVNSDDRATNKNTSSNYFDRAEGAVSAAEVSFILDTTDPEVVGLHVDGGDLDETLKGEFSVVDDIGVKEVKVVLSGNEELAVEQNDFGGYSFDVPGRSIDLSRDITVVATDLAGNNGSGATSISSILLFIIIGVLLLVVAAIGGAVYFVRRNDIDLFDAVSAEE